MLGKLAYKICYYSGQIRSGYAREIKASPRGEAVREAD